MNLIDVVKSSSEDVHKLVFKNTNGNILEVSYIRKGDGKDILCVPTQTSCNMGCKFCHLTGLEIPAENLAGEEIVELVEAALQFKPASNPTLLVSYMGAGEPLLNIQGLFHSAMKLLRTPNYQQVRFGVSTLLPGKKPFDELTKLVAMNGLPCKLHWSMHSTKADIRKNLMPSALPIKEALALLSNYMETTNQPVEIHYTLIKGVNDTQEDIDNLVSLVDKKINIKLLRFAPHRNEPNLIESDFVQDFKSKLENNGFHVEAYCPPGRDIGSSCGQFTLDRYTN